MRRFAGTLLIVLGFLFLLAAGLFVRFNFVTQEDAGVQAQQALINLAIPRETIANKSADQAVDSTVPTVIPDEIPDYVLNPEMDMPEKQIDGISYIGALSIPSLDLELPVISTTTKSLLRIAPCRYTGTAYLDNLVIGAHNYSTHFGRIKTLSYGDLIEFTDMDGNLFVYQVADMEVLNPDQVEDLCSGQWPLTLYTCTIGGRTRVTVRCDKVQTNG